MISVKHIFFSLSVSSSDVTYQQHAGKYIQIEIRNKTTVTPSKNSQLTDTFDQRSCTNDEVLQQRSPEKQAALSDSL